MEKSLIIAGLVENWTPVLKILCSYNTDYTQPFIQHILWTYNFLWSNDRSQAHIKVKDIHLNYFNEWNMEVSDTVVQEDGASVVNCLFWC